MDVHDPVVAVQRLYFVETGRPLSDQLAHLLVVEVLTRCAAVYRMRQRTDTAREGD